MSPASEMSDADVLATLESAAAADRAEERGEQVVETQGTPAGVTETQSSQVQPVPPVATETQNTETFDGGRFNPDELPPELQPAWKQLQAAYTQKTQELAQERSQFAELGSPEELQQAVDLYSRITDPSNWAQLHQELTEAMQERGLSPAAASAAATDAMSTAATVADPNLDSIDDPDLAPVVQALKETRAELAAIRTERDTDRQNALAEQNHMLYLGELQRQENIIRASHPEWAQLEDNGDSKMETIYKMSSFYGGNITEAAADLDQLLSSERELYLRQKATAMTDSTRTTSQRAVTSATDRSTAPETLREAEAEAEEFFKARLAELEG